MFGCQQLSDKLFCFGKRNSVFNMGVNSSNLNAGSIDYNKHDFRVSKNLVALYIDGVAKTTEQQLIDGFTNSFYGLGSNYNGVAISYCACDFEYLELSHNSETHKFIPDGIVKKIKHYIDDVAQTDITIQGTVLDAQFVAL